MVFSPVQAASGECTAAGDVIRLLFLQTSGTQLLSFPSKANSRHSSSQNISEGETQTDRLSDRQTDRQRHRETDSIWEGFSALHATTDLELEQNWPDLVVLPVRMAGVLTKGDHDRATRGFYGV